MKPKRDNVIRLGLFHIACGELLISDPCYDVNPFDNFVGKAVNGEWEAEVLKHNGGAGWGIRCAALRVHLSTHDKNSSPDTPWLELGCCGVDSGQLGVYDLERFKDESSVPPAYLEMLKDGDNWDKHVICEDEPWYSYNCWLTLSDPGAAVLPFGAASRSGYGDGGYLTYGQYTDEKLVAVLVDFGIIEDFCDDPNKLIKKFEQ